MEHIPSAKIIDLTPYLRRARRRARLALWTQYLSLGALVLYGLLRALTPVPLGTYCGPLALLWPASFLLLLASYAADSGNRRTYFKSNGAPGRHALRRA